MPRERRAEGQARRQAQRRYEVRQELHRPEPRLVRASNSRRRGRGQAGYAQVEGEAKRIIGEAHERVAADRDFTVGLTFDAGTALYERSTVSRRVETIYGVIAQAPALAESAQDALRRFIVRRRYRGTVRMVFDVNPNANGYFNYRGACAQPHPPDRPGWRTNIETRDLWEPIGADDAPLRVKVPTGGCRGSEGRGREALGRARRRVRGQPVRLRPHAVLRVDGHAVRGRGRRQALQGRLRPRA